MKLTGKTRLCVIALLGLVLVGSMTVLITRMMDYKQGEEDYSEAEDLVELPDFSDLPAPALDTLGEAPAFTPARVTEDGEPAESGEPRPVYIDPYADALNAMDFTALREVNSDVLGWIVIPGTVISYPLLQGPDNDYYLNHTWKKWNSAVGAIFMEWRCDSDLSNFNTIIYGHRMRNGSMFASLKNYRQRSWWAAHPCVYITNDSGTYKYDIFAAYEVSVEGDTYRLGFSSETTRQNFIDYCLEQSVINTGIVPQTYESILTLSTCTGRGHATRWVVQAVLHCDPPAEPGPEPEPEIPGEPAEPDVTDVPETPAVTDPPGGTDTPDAPADAPEDVDTPADQPGEPDSPAEPPSEPPAAGEAEPPPAPEPEPEPETDGP